MEIAESVHTGRLRQTRAGAVFKPQATKILNFNNFMRAL